VSVQIFLRWLYAHSALYYGQLETVNMKGIAYLVSGT
jgi:hypothetical protein